MNPLEKLDSLKYFGSQVTVDGGCGQRMSAGQKMC